jgi:dGTPase
MSDSSALNESLNGEPTAAEIWHAAQPPAAIIEQERTLLAPYAFASAASRGRRFAEAAHPYRGPFQRDRDRIVHTAAYRRLGYKTQVFTGNWGDYPRSRLTHTIEVSSVARSIGRALRLNEDLVEALAVLHDIGHPPFGHAGEDTLDECLAEEGGFNHNRQALRIVEFLERRYPSFPGLNLSFEILDSQRARAEKKTSPGGPSPLLEAQVVDAADSITYDTHDADDALELGLLELDELLRQPLWSEAARRVRSQYADLDEKTLRRAVYRELIDWQVGEVIEATLARLREQGVSSSKQAQAVPPLIAPHAETQAAKKELEAFLHRRVYRHERVVRMRRRAQGYLRAMFQYFNRMPDLLPDSFQRSIPTMGLRRTIGDYLAGMTDRYARGQYRRHLG